MSKLIKWGLLAILAVAILIKVSLWLSVRSIMNDAIAQMQQLPTVLAPITRIRKEELN